MLAVQLVSAFQRVKLGGILDLFQLFDRTAAVAHYRTMWGADPVPLAELWKDAYAGLVVTDFWRANLDSADSETAALAEIEFNRWRRGTADAVEQLRESTGLTALGGQFVDRMAQDMQASN